MIGKKERRTRQVMIRLSPGEKAKLQELSSRDGRTMAGWVRRKIRERYIEAFGKGP